MIKRIMVSVGQFFHAGAREHCVVMSHFIFIVIFHRSYLMMFLLLLWLACLLEFVGVSSAV